MTCKIGSWASLFWILGLLEVHCVTDPYTGDITCYLHTVGGKEIICEQGAEQAEATKRLDIRPTTDATCMAPFFKW